MRAASMLVCTAWLCGAGGALRAQGDARAGLFLPTATALMRLPAAPAPSARATAALPAETDLSGRLPPAGDQGHTNTCAGWAVGYGICSSMLASLSNDGNARRSAPDTTRLYSPGFIYALALRGAPCGSDVFLSDALHAADSAGCCTWSALPFDAVRIDRDCLDVPPEALRTASYLRLASVHRLASADADAVRAALAAQHLVVINANVDTSFAQAGDRAGGVRPFTWRPVTFSDTYGHAMVCMGYRDADSTFLVQNSWGQHWGDRGTFRLPYAVYRSYVSEAYAVEPVLRAVALVPAHPHAGTPVHAAKRTTADLAAGASVQHGPLQLTALSVPTNSDAAVLRVERVTTNTELCDLYLAPGEERTLYDAGSAYTVQRKATKLGRAAAHLVITTTPADRDPTLQQALHHVEQMRALGAR